MANQTSTQQRFAERIFKYSQESDNTSGEKEVCNENGNNIGEKEVCNENGNNSGEKEVCNENGNDSGEKEVCNEKGNNSDEKEVSNKNESNGGRKLDVCKDRGRVPQYSRLHGQVPRLYVQEWKTDMKNRELIIKNAELGGVPHYEHDENLFLDKREQMHYNVENRNRVDAKCQMPARELLLRPPFHHETSRYQSELMFRRDEDAQ